jgi:hypothetical protein
LRTAAAVSLAVTATVATHTMATNSSFPLFIYVSSSPTVVSGPPNATRLASARRA